MNDLIVIARNPQEMEAAQSQLVAWVDNKIHEADQQLADFQQNLALAQRERWKTSGLTTACRLARRKCQFYEKMKAAIEAGYVIVPNFPIDVFAIRTEKEEPKQDCSIHRHDRRLQRSEAPQLGKGRNVSNEPVIVSQKEVIDEKTTTYYWADAFQEVDFPLKFAKITVLDDVGKALALNIFDEIGVLPARAAKVDPMVIGQIVYRGSHSYTERRLSFLITWWLNEEHLTI